MSERGTYGKAGSTPTWHWIVGGALVGAGIFATRKVGKDRDDRLRRIDQSSSWEVRRLGGK
jgi:hypothetical protein